MLWLKTKINIVIKLHNYGPSKSQVFIHSIIFSESYRKPINTNIWYANFYSYFTRGGFRGCVTGARPPPPNLAQLTDQLIFSPHLAKVKRTCNLSNNWQWNLCFINCFGCFGCTFYTVYDLQHRSSCIKTPAVSWLSYIPSNMTTSISPLIPLRSLPDPTR